MLLTLVTKFLGFGREIVLSSSFGTSALSDAYILSIAIPGFFFTIMSSAINSAYIPTIVKLDNKEKQNVFSSEVFRYFLIITVVIVIFIFSFPSFFVNIYASNLPIEVRHLAESLLRVTCFSLIFRITVSIYNSYLQFKEFYIVNTLLGLPLNIIIILSILFASKDNYEILGYGFLVAMISQILLIFPFVIMSGYKFSIGNSLRVLEFRNFSKLIFFIVAGVAVSEINMLIDINVASGLGVGNVSSINYALKLNVFIQAVFVTSIILVFFPNISKLAQGIDVKVANSFFNSGLEILVFLLLPISLFTSCFSSEIVELIFFNGEFDESSLFTTSQALFYYSLGFVFFGFREFLIKTFYAIGDMKKPMWNTLWGVVLNASLTIVLSEFMGIGGIALATSISSFFLCSLLIYNLTKNELFTIKKRCVIRQVQWITLSSFIPLIFILHLSRIYSLSVLIYISLFITLYLLLTFLFKVNVAIHLFEGVKNKIWK